jgi:hypothetical protein
VVKEPTATGQRNAVVEILPLVKEKSAGKRGLLSPENFKDVVEGVGGSRTGS